MLSDFLNIYKTSGACQIHKPINEIMCYRSFMYFDNEFVFFCLISLVSGVAVTVIFCQIYHSFL